MQSATLILPGRGTKGGSEAMAASELSVLVPGDQVDERVLVHVDQDAEIEVAALAREGQSEELTL